MEGKIYTHDEAMMIVEMFEDVLSDNDIIVPSPEDEDREDGNNACLYGSTYSDLLDSVEERICEILERHVQGTEVIKYQFSGNYIGEHGTTVKMPCKIGDDVYSIPGKERYKLNIFNGFPEENCVRHYIVEEISFDKSGWRVDCEIDGEAGYTILLENEFCKTWFLSEQEAEDALEEMYKGGDIVELPCNPGDTIYVIGNCMYVSPILDGDMYDGAGGPGDATGYYCPYELNGKCPHNVDDCKKAYDKTMVFEDTADSINITENGMEITASLTGVRSELSNYIFLTKEDAEKEFNKMQKGDNG